MSTPNGLIWKGQHITGRELRDRASRGAMALESLGIADGSRVALLMRNCPAFFEVTLGAAHLGALTVPLNWHLTGPEITHILQDSGACLIVAEEAMLSTLDEATCAGCRVVSLGQWRDLLEASEPYSAEPRVVSNPIFYTSGTTGQPKGVLRKRGTNEAAVLQRDLHCFGLDYTDIRSVMTGPLYHSAPNAYGMIVIESGGLLVLQDRFDPEGLLQLIERHRITNLHMVPTMFARLLALPPDAREIYDLSSLRHVVHGAAPCPPEIKRQMIEWWGPIIHEYYAMTETGFIAASSSAEWLERPYSVGRAAPGVEIEIRDEDGKSCLAGVIGEVCVRTETSADVSYHGDKAKTDALHDCGFLRTGDTGFLDEKGFLTISGRKSDLVISGGVNIYPAEIESALSSLDGVADCAVFGIPDPEFGESLVAVVQPEEGVALNAEDIIDLLRDTLAGFKIPRNFYFMDTLPREDSGKVKKAKLRDQLFGLTIG